MPQLGTRTLALALALAACGGGDKKNNTPDAPMNQVDSAPADAPRVCTALQYGTVDIASYTPGQVIVFRAPGGDPGDGNALTLQFEFYSGIETSLMGTFDLSMGNQNNYKTCAACVRAYSVDQSGMPIKTFFQKSGSVTLSEDPLTNGHLIASFSNLELEEVTIADDYTSTPVTGGECTNYGASFNIDHDRVPNAWTCPHAGYADGTNCECACGMVDPDCDATSTQTVNGCTSGQPVCSSGACAAVVANDTCANAVTLTLGTAVQGTTVGAYNTIKNGLADMTTCTGFAEAGAEVAYKVHLTGGTAYAISLTGLDPGFDGAVYVLGPGTATVCDADPITTCVAGMDQGLEGADENATYTPTTTGDYYVIVDSFYAAETGAFTLKVQ
jgi:hypothetical protein